MSEVWTHNFSLCWESLLSDIVSKVWKFNDKVEGAVWSSANIHGILWTDGELTYWEFFCENCLDIRITNNKRGFKLHENENEAKDSR